VHTEYGQALYINGEIDTLTFDNVGYYVGLHMFAGRAGDDQDIPTRNLRSHIDSSRDRGRSNQRVSQVMLDRLRNGRLEMLVMSLAETLLSSRPGYVKQFTVTYSLKDWTGSVRGSRRRSCSQDQSKRIPS
jgi:hypothetical protein